ncbi:MAG: hypothetical protein EHM48_03450 [Planctomycetaceae bacterium]|nr:MAG: hypothetical protein EHM48_03450 [Planctomycetaceae bacterium]
MRSAKCEATTEETKEEEEKETKEAHGQDAHATNNIAEWQAGFKYKFGIHNTNIVNWGSKEVARVNRLTGQPVN